MKLGLKYYPQYESYSCGPVSLRMVFKHLGKVYSEKKMISLCHSMPKTGTSHKHMIEEIKNENFRYIQKNNGTIDNIITFLNAGYPVIINYYNPLSKCTHYSVIEGYNSKEKILILADPANGNDYSLHYKEFESLWYDEKITLKGWFLIIGREKIIF